jgi:hypothetical protein
MAFAKSDEAPPDANQRHRCLYDTRYNRALPFPASKILSPANLTFEG